MLIRHRSDAVAAGAVAVLLAAAAWELAVAAKVVHFGRAVFSLVEPDAFD